MMYDLNNAKKISQCQSEHNLKLRNDKKIKLVTAPIVIIYLCSVL